MGIAFCIWRQGKAHTLQTKHISGALKGDRQRQLQRAGSVVWECHRSAGGPRQRYERLKQQQLAYQRTTAAGVR